MADEDLFLEDEVDDAPGGYRPNIDDDDLFGDNDDEPQQQQNEFLRPPSPPPAPRLSAAEQRRQELQALAAKQREAEGEGDGSRKKQKTDKKGDNQRKGKDGSKKDKRSKPQEGAAADDYQAEELFGSEDELDEEQLEQVETDADKAFIDDAGVAPVSDDDDEPQHEIRHDEAEEGHLDEIDLLLKQRKRRRGPDEQQITEMVTGMTARMELAAEEDQKAQAVGKPAIHKLRMIRDVEQFMANRLLHEEFLANNGLAALSQWIAPYEDGSVPNTKVRETVLRCLRLLPINTSFQNHVDWLKESKLGRHVMLLMKLPDETLDNKKRAKELVEAWSRPIFADSQAEEEKKRQKRLELERARQMNKKHSAVDEAKRKEQSLGVKRVHAMIPQSSKLDYVNEPQSAVEAEKQQGGGKQSGGALEKKGREILRRNKQTSDRALKPSIEGRGMVLYHG